MARCSAFIKLNPRLLVFHGFQKRLGLAFAHLALLLGFGFRLRQPAHSYLAVFVICRRRLPSLHRQISWIPLELRKVSHCPLHLLRAMVMAFHFLLLRPGSAILRLAVPLVRVKAVDLVASRHLEREKGSRQAVFAAVFFAARSSPATGCSFPVGLSGSQTCPVTPDPAIAAGPGLAAGFAVPAGPGLAAVADPAVVAVAFAAVVAVAAAADFAAAVVVASAAAAFSCEQAQRVVEALGH